MVIVGLFRQANSRRLYTLGLSHRECGRHESARDAFVPTRRGGGDVVDRELRAAPNPTSAARGPHTPRYPPPPPLAAGSAAVVPALLSLQRRDLSDLSVTIRLSKLPAPTPQAATRRRSTLRDVHDELVRIYNHLDCGISYPNLRAHDLLPGILNLIDPNDSTSYHSTERVVIRNLEDSPLS